MKLIRTLGLCLVAVFAISAIAVASASAANPEFKACVKAAKVGKTYVGKYTSKECTNASKVETGGKYERAEIEAAPFTTKSKAVTINAAGKVVICKKSVGAGEVLFNEAESMTITFSKCGVNGSTKAPCTTAGELAGTIKTGELVGAPHWINAAETEPGVALFAPGEEFVSAEFACGETTIALHSILLGTATNTKKGITLGFALSGGKEQHRAYWEEEEEVTGFGESLPFHLYTQPGKVEATVEGAIEQGPKGVGIF